MWTLKPKMVDRLEDRPGKEAKEAVLQSSTAKNDGQGLEQPDRAGEKRVDGDEGPTIEVDPRDVPGPGKECGVQLIIAYTKDRQSGRFQTAWEKDGGPAREQDQEEGHQKKTAVERDPAGRSH